MLLRHNMFLPTAGSHKAEIEAYFKFPLPKNRNNLFCTCFNIYYQEAPKHYIKTWMDQGWGNPVQTSKPEACS